MATATKAKPNPIDIEIGARVRTLRGVRKITQTQLAETCIPPITFQQIQKYEKGTNRISGSRLTQIAAALNVEVADLFPSTEPGETMVSALGLDRMDFEIARLAHDCPTIRPSLKALLEQFTIVQSSKKGRPSLARA